jgi:hypothetical protein
MNIRGVLLLFCIMTSCTTATLDGAKRSIKSLHFASLKMRNPVSISADPDVGPGGVDYQTATNEEPHYGCKSPSEFFSKLKKAEIRDCLLSVTDEVIVEYQLKRTDSPHWRLQDPELAPVCIVDLMTQISIPREIFFQSSDESNLECYSSKIFKDKDEVLGAKVPINQLNLEIQFPLVDSIRTEGDLDSFFMRLVLRPYFEGQPMKIDARRVPARVCRECLPKSMLLDTQQKYPSWPE